MIKVTLAPSRDETLEMLFLKTLEYRDFNQMILPFGLISNPPTKIGHMKVSESELVESGTVVVMNTECKK